MLNIQAQKIDHKNLENQFNKINCIYRNESEYIQVIRISQSKSAFFERTVFPNQCVNFSALGDDLLEIWEFCMASSVHADTIPCTQLLVSTGIDRNQNHDIPRQSNRGLQDILAVAA